MSENNGGNSGLAPQPHGGALRTGGVPGNKGGTGRPKSEVRQACVEGFESALPILMRIATDENNVTQAERLKAIDLLGKYGGLQQTDVTSGDAALQTVTVVFEAETPMSTIDAILASE